MDAGQGERPDRGGWYPAQPLDAGKEVEHAGGGQVVIDLGAAAFINDNAGILEHGQVFGDGGEVRAHQIAQFADAARSIGQGLDHEQSARVRQGFDDLGALFMVRPGLDGR